MRFYNAYVCVIYLCFWSWNFGNKEQYCMCAALAYTIPLPAFYTEILVNCRLGQCFFLILSTSEWGLHSPQVCGIDKKFSIFTASLQCHFIICCLWFLTGCLKYWDWQWGYSISMKQNMYILPWIYNLHFFCLSFVVHYCHGQVKMFSLFDKELELYPFLRDFDWTNMFYNSCLYELV